MRLILTAALLTIGLVGCEDKQVIVVVEPPVDPPKGVEVLVIDDAATIAEIDAVRTLSFSSERADHLVQIARRHALGPHAQPHLVETAFGTLSFSGEKLSVVLALIKNPVFSDTGRKAVLTHLDQLTFSSERQRVLHALDEHPPEVVFEVGVADRHDPS